MSAVCCPSTLSGHNIALIVTKLRLFIPKVAWTTFADEKLGHKRKIDFFNTLRGPNILEIRQTVKCFDDF
jgi:hypothetical protein